MKLTQENYFSKEANLHYMSVSQFKDFEGCQAAALAKINGEIAEEKTTALLVGSYVDAYFEGTLPQFIEQTPEMFKRDGTLKKDFLQANEIIDRIKRDPLFMEYMSGEKQVIMTGTIKGVPVKIKVDSLHPDKIVDGKVMANFKDVKDPERGTLPWFEAWGYDLQGAVYQEIVRQNTGRVLPFYLAAATKEKVTDIDIVHINQKLLDFALERFERDVELYEGIKMGIIEADRCEKCEYCKSTKVLTEPTDADEFYLI